MADGKIWTQVDEAEVKSDNTIEFESEGIGAFAFKDHNLTPNPLILYNYGDVCTATSGGWEKWKKGSYEFLEDCLRIHWNYGQYATLEYCLMKTVNAIDLTPYKTIHAIVMQESGPGSKNYPDVRVGSMKSNGTDGADLLYWDVTEGMVEKSADISSLTGERCLYINGCYCLGSSGYGRLYKLWLTTD